MTNDYDIVREAIEEDTANTYYHEALAALSRLEARERQLVKSVEDVNEAWKWDQGHLHELRTQLERYEGALDDIATRALSVGRERVKTMEPELSQGEPS